MKIGLFFNICTGLIALLKEISLYCNRNIGTSEHLFLPSTKVSFVNLLPVLDHMLGE